VRFSGKDYEPASTSQKGVTFISGENSRGLLTEKLKDLTCGGNFTKNIQI